MKVIKCSDQAYSRVCAAAAERETFLADALDFLVFKPDQPVFQWRDDILGSDSTVGEKLTEELRRQGSKVMVRGEESGQPPPEPREAEAEWNCPPGFVRDAETGELIGLI